MMSDTPSERRARAEKLVESLIDGGCQSRYMVLAIDAFGAAEYQRALEDAERALTAIATPDFQAEIVAVVRNLAGHAQVMTARSTWKAQ